MTHHVNRRSSAFIALVTLIVLIVGAFFVVKAMNSEVVEVKVIAQEVWYEVTPISNSETPSDLEISSGPNGNPPNTSECNINNSGEPCAAHLSFPNNDAPTSVPTGTTLQDLMDDYGASLILNKLGEPEFTRKDQ